MAKTEDYRPEDYSKKETAMMQKFRMQVDDAREYFLSCIKPRLDRSYKLYIAYNGDRAKQIKRWQANIFIPYTQAVVETLMPRILDARPDFVVQGRNSNDQLKANKLQDLTDYTWEIAKMDSTNELITRSSLIYGSGYFQVSWKKDVRTNKFLKSTDLTKKKYEWKKETKTFYDAPYAEWVDNYSLWYDWRNVPKESKQFWFKRLVLTGASIKRRYNAIDKKRLAMAFESGAGDLTDYASVRNEVKTTQEGIVKGDDHNVSSSGITTNIYDSQDDPDLKMHEVFEWWRPFDDSYAVMVNDIPVLKGGEMPNPYDFKEAPFINVPYLKLSHEFEGYGLPMILEQPQIMLNMIKNQRLDSVTMSIHKMWIVNPLANVDKNELVTRPFGIIYTPIPDSVKEVQFSDVKSSSYKEEELLKGDMRYGSGVDDFSMGAASNTGSATGIRHLRESTLERVRLFINHLGDAYADLMRYWLSMYRQFFTESMTIRIIGDDGKELYPLIEKDDLMGQFDYKAAVLPSIAGKNDIEKKQGMDLFQLLINLPFVDPRKLTSKILHSWDWSLDSVAKDAGEGQELPPGAEGEMPPGAEGAMPAGMPEGMPPAGQQMPQQGQMKGVGAIPPAVMKEAIAMLGGTPAPGGSQFAEAGAPIDLLQGGAMPPTVAPIGKTTNPRGLNRSVGGGVNTNIPLKQNSNPEASLLNQAQNIQR